jgi:hypothetical protein
MYDLVLGIRREWYHNWLAIYLQQVFIGVEVMTLLVRLSVAEGSLHVRNTSRDLSLSREVFALPVDEEILLRDFYAKVRIFLC